MAVPPIYVDRITAGDHEVFEDTDGEFQGLVRLEVQSASSFDSTRLLVDQRRLSDGFFLNSLSILSVESVEWTGKIGLNSSRTKIIFSLAGPSPPFCCCIYWCGDTQKGHLGCCSSPCDSPLLLPSGLCSGVCALAYGGQMLPPEVLAREAFWKAALLNARWHQRKKKSQAKVLMVRNWTSILDAIRSTPVHLHPTLVVEPGGMRKEPVSVRRRLNLTGKESFSVKSVSTPI